MRVKALVKGRCPDANYTAVTGPNTVSGDPSSWPRSLKLTGRLLEEPMGRRGEAMGEPPSPTPGPARSLFSHPTTWFFPGPDKTLSPNGKMFFPCHSRAQPNLTQLWASRGPGRAPSCFPGSCC